MTYFYGLLLLSFLAGAAEYLCPGGEGGIRKHLRLLCGLLLLTALFRPLLSLGAELRDGDWEEALRGLWADVSGADGERESTAKEQWEAETARLDTAFAAERIEAFLCQQYNVGAGCVSVTVYPNETGDGFARLSVALSGRGIWLDAAQIEATMRETFGCDCTVYVQRSGEE